MIKPKFKPSIKEITDLNKDCLRAVSIALKDEVTSTEYPLFMDDGIMNGDFVPKQIMKAWSRNKILWKYGYAEYLNESSVRLFKQYRFYLLKKRVYKKERESLAEYKADLKELKNA